MITRINNEEEHLIQRVGATTNESLPNHIEMGNVTVRLHRGGRIHNNLMIQTRASLPRLFTGRKD